MTAHSSARASARIGRPLEDGSRDDVSPSRPAAADAHIALQSVSATFLPWLGRAQPIGRRGRHKPQFYRLRAKPTTPALCRRLSDSRRGLPPAAQRNGHTRGLAARV